MFKKYIQQKYVRKRRKTIKKSFEKLKKLPKKIRKLQITRIKLASLKAITY